MEVHPKHCQMRTEDKVTSNNNTQLPGEQLTAVLGMKLDIFGDCIIIL